MTAPLGATRAVQAGRAGAAVHGDRLVACWPAVPVLAGAPAIPAARSFVHHPVYFLSDPL
jgi:hypothetical protein